MMSSYYYSRTKGTTTKCCVARIEPTTDVEMGIYEYLSKRKGIALEDIKLRYIISKIKPACDGCLNEYLGQQDHMDCPYGCLHDRDTCTVCNNI